jgi:site-specific recombinase
LNFIKKFLTGVEKFILAGKIKYDLNTLLSSANPKLSLEKRVEWIQDLMTWIRSTEKIPIQFDTSIGQIHTARVRFILQLLDRNPEWKQTVSQTLRSVIHETSALQLFCNTGLPNEAGFLQEATDRVLNKIIPTPPEEKELSELFLKIFPREEDAIWVENLSTETIIKIHELILFESDEYNVWAKIKNDIEDAIYILTSQIHAIGLSDIFRNRTNLKNIKDSPFIALSDYVDAFLNSYNNVSHDNLTKYVYNCDKYILECKKSIQEVFHHLDEYGISVTLVYQLEKVSFHLARLEILLLFLYKIENANKYSIIPAFIAKLIRESIEKKSIRALVQTNLNQLSRKIVERAGHTGEHYITSNKKEYFHMFKSAAGGGLITGFTTLFKTIIVHSKLAIFFEGFFASINYACSFVFIQLLGFTLATKQPSMTASAMAGKLHNVQDEKLLNEFIDEVTKLTRSQFSAIFGNIVVVMPTVFLIDFSYKLITGNHVLNIDRAHKVVQSFSIIGPSIFYAIFTGVLLWLSSIIAGWLENWAVYRRLPEAIAKNKRLIFVFGENNANRFSAFFKNNISGFGGNVSLGIMLGMTPSVGMFFGIPLDVRHVTLAAGGFSFALSSIGLNEFYNSDFILACFGIVAIGLLNLSVSFWLAMSVAIRARKIQSVGRKIIRKAIIKRLLSSPLEFFYPTQKNN